MGFGPQEEVFLERQYPSPNSIQGTWRTAGGILTLLDNGQFVLSEVGGEPPNGMEASPYFFDEENAKVTFYVYVDKNIGGGLVDNANIDGQSVTFPVSFDETSLNLFADGGWITFWRQ